MSPGPIHSKRRSRNMALSINPPYAVNLNRSIADFLKGSFSIIEKWI
jgi:hypothetical protein